MAAFSPTIRQFGDVTSRQKPWTRWYKQHKGLALGSLGLILVVVIGAGLWWNWQGQDQPAPGGQLDEGLVGQPQRLNPLYSQANPVDAQLTPLIFRSILKYDQNLNLVGDLADSWQQSQDGKTYLITLGSHYWQDGQPVTTDDLIFTINLTQDKNYTGNWSNSFTGVTMKKTSSKVVELTLDQPHAPFAQNLTIGLLPQHLLKNISAAQLANHDFNLKPVGNGLLTFDSLQTNTNNQITDLKFTLNRGYIQTLVYHFYQDNAALVNDFKLGKIQSFGSLPNSDLKALDDFDKQQQHQVLSGQSYGLYFNLQSNNVKELKIRQALAYSLNKDSLLNATLGQHWTNLDNVYPQISWANYDKLSPISYDAAKAQQAVAEIKTKPTKLTLVVADQDLQEELANKIADNWTNLGLPTQVISRQGPALTNLLNSGSGYDVILLAEKARQDPDRYNTWHSTQVPPIGLNISHLNNARIDRALVDARKLLSREERKVKYTTFQTLLSQELPVIWLYQPHYLYTWSNKIHNVTLPPLWDESDRYQTIEQWYINQAKR